MMFYQVFCIFPVKWGNHLDSVCSNGFSGIFSSLKVPVLG